MSEPNCVHDFVRSVCTAGDGAVDGVPEDIAEGECEGAGEGACDGSEEGGKEGDCEGAREGDCEGAKEGAMDGIREGASDVLFSAGVGAMEVLAALNESLLGVLASGGSVDREGAWLGMAEGLAVGARVTLVIGLSSRLRCLCTTSVAMYVSTKPRLMPNMIHFKRELFRASRCWNKDSLATVPSVSARTRPAWSVSELTTVSPLPCLSLFFHRHSETILLFI